MGNWRTQDANQFIKLAENASRFLLDESQNLKGATFEVMIFNSMQILGRFKLKRPNLFNQFEADYTKELYNYAVQQGITNIIICEFWLFVNQRFTLYNQELDTASNDSIPFIKTSFNFYKNPLQEKSGIHLDIILISKLPRKMQEAFAYINQAVDRFIEERDL